MARSWTDDEPGWAGARRELARIRRRVRSRWVKTLLITILVTCAFVFYQSRKQRVFESTVVFRVVEGNFDAHTAPPTNVKLKDHVWSVLLSGTKLLAIMKEAKLYQSQMSIDPTVAIEAMRDDIDVEVLRNYFGLVRDEGDPPRSARVGITYRSGDPHVAFDTARRLGTAIAEQETAARQALANAETDAATRTVLELHEQLSVTRNEQVKLQLDRPKDKIAEQLRAVRLRRTYQEAAALEVQLTEAQRDRANLHLRTTIEGKRMGMRFELVDPGRPARVILTRTDQLILLAVLGFFFLLPVVSVGVGAFDNKVYDVEDLRRLGLEPFGFVPSFERNGLGTLDARLDSDMGGTCKT